MRLYFNLNKITYLFRMQALYLCIACEEPFDVGMPIPEDAIVFDGVITDEPPPYYFVLSKPSTKLKYPENRSFDRINDAEIVIVDLTTGIRDTLQNAKLTGYQDFRFYDHYRDKDVTVYMKWLPGETPGGLYVTNKIYGVENHTYELHIKYKGKEYTACERMVPKTPIDKIVMKRIDTGEGEPNETPCISFYNPPEEHNYYLLKTDFCSSKVLRVASVYNLYYGTTNSAGWPYSILDDEYLAENVIDYVVSEGEQFVLPNRPGFSYPVSDSIWIKMQSISENCYQVFDQMIKQIRSDGGTFSPRPTSVKSNIDNGAYGIFRVSAISEIYFYKKHRI